MSDVPPPLRAKDRIADAALGLVLALLMALPYAWRVRFCGWAFAWVVAPLNGARKKAERNLRRTLPDLPAAEMRRLLRAVPANVGRTMVELASGAEFLARAGKSPVTGAGLDAVLKAHAAGRGVILVSGHFGNYDVSRAVLSAHGVQVGGLYQVPLNPLIHARYVAAISQYGTPVFPRGRRGLAHLVRHLRGGGIAGMLIDWHMDHGAELRFFGRPAQTALSAAELALKYDLLLVPVYGLRQPDGISFELVVEEPLPQTTAEAMTQALNDSLEAMTRRHLEQWFWIQPRWRADDKARRRARRKERGKTGRKDQSSREAANMSDGPSV